MKFIGELVEKLGISLRSLATLLNTDHTHLSRYESHTRNLPLAAIPGVIQLFAWLEKVPPTPVPQPTEADKTAAQKNADWCRVQCIPLQGKLAAMQKSWEQGATLLYIVEQYEAANKEALPKMKSWAAGQRFAATQKIGANGWAAQQEVKRKIALLEADARFWEERIAPSDK